MDSIKLKIYKLQGTLNYLNALNKISSEQVKQKEILQSEIESLKKSQEDLDKNK